MDTPKYRNCDLCGTSYKDEHTYMGMLCTPCWYIPDHVPECQIGKWYRRLYEKAGVPYPEDLIPENVKRWHG